MNDVSHSHQSQLPQHFLNNVLWIDECFGHTSFKHGGGQVMIWYFTIKCGLSLVSSSAQIHVSNNIVWLSYCFAVKA